MTAPLPQIANPYASPATVDWTSGADAVLSNTTADPRARRINAEVSLKQNMLCLVGMFSLLAVVSDFDVLITAAPEPDYVRTAMEIVFTFLATASIVVNFGVRRFASWTRLPLTLLAFMSLPLVPVGSVFGLLILKTLHLGKTPRLLTQEYEQIVRATPHLNQRTSFLTWFGVILLIILAISIVYLAQIPAELRHPR